MFCYRISHKWWPKLLKISIYFDECPYIISPIEVCDLHYFCINSDVKITDFINFISNIIDTEGSIDATAHAKKLKDFQIEMYSFLVKNEKSLGLTLYISKMLLCDIDLCLKMFIYCQLKHHYEIEAFAQEFFYAASVSDTRVSVINDLIQSWVDLNEPKVLSVSEVNKALDNMKIKNVVVFNMQRNLSIFKSKLSSPYIVYEYSILNDFSVDWDVLGKLRNTFCYIIIEPSLKIAEYNALINTCIINAITPLFILYNTSNAKMNKEMFKRRWIVSLIYVTSFKSAKEYIRETENCLNHDFCQYSKFYDNFQKTIEGIGTKKAPIVNSREESDAGWEVLSTIDKSVFIQLVEELTSGTKLVGSLHYYFFKELEKQGKQDIYWSKYGQLFGITEKYVTMLDINCSKTLLHAYTLQTVPAFYKMLNDAFRIGTEESVSKYRAFFTMLHDSVKKKILRKYVGTVYRGTYFSPEVISNLKLGQQINLSCFTSTSKSQSVAWEFARKTKRNVLLEIELNSKADSNVDIHAENCSRYPEEQEVLLLPFSVFKIMRIFKEENLTLISLTEMIPEYELINLKGIDYNN